MLEGGFKRPHWLEDIVDEITQNAPAGKPILSVRAMKAGGDKRKTFIGWTWP